MFDKQYRFTGSHAEKVSALTSIFDEVAKAKIFERNLDVYMNAPLIGNRKNSRRLVRVKCLCQTIRVYGSTR